MPREPLGFFGEIAALILFIFIIGPLIIIELVMEKAPDRFPWEDI